MSEIISIQVKKGKRKPMKPLAEARAIPGIGLEGGHNNRFPNGKRQVLVMPVELLEHFNLAPGIVREQITTRGVDVMALRKGDHLRIGDVLLEATGECTPCSMLEDIRPGLQAAMEGKRGMLFKVRSGGMIHIGDLVEIVTSEPVVG